MADKYKDMLSVGCLEKILDGDASITHPVLQMVGVKNVPSKDGINRYRLFVNDGISTHSFFMLATSINYMYETGDFTEFSIFRADRFVPSKAPVKADPERNVMIIFNMTVLAKGTDVREKLTVENKPGKENLGGNAPRRPMPASPAQKPRGGNEQNSFFDPSSHLTMPIESLSPYHNKWVIKARVTAKSGIRTWSNAKGEGKLFNFDVCDESGEIRITAFRECVDTYFNMIEVDKVYYISKCQIKPANKQYSKLKNDYEMTCSSETVIQPCNEDVESIPKLRYEFVTIAELGQKEANSIVDVVAVCKEATDATKLTAKTTGRELTKREVTLVDNSGSSIMLTLWGDDATNFDIRDNPTVALKNVQLKEYMGGKTLSTLSSTVMKINPDIPEGIQVRGWFENEGSSNTFNTLSTKSAAGGGNIDWLTFHEVKARNLGSAGEKADYFSTIGMIHSMKKDNMLYKACANKDCNKKVVDNNDGTYRCDKCNMESSNYKNRLLTNILFGDWTSNRWVTLFAEIAEQVLGKNGDEIAEMLEQGQKEVTDKYFEELNFKPMMMKIRTKIETYGDIPRPKNSAVSVGPVPYKEYNKYLLKNIHRLCGIEKAKM